MMKKRNYVDIECDGGKKKKIRKLRDHGFAPFPFYRAMRSIIPKAYGFTPALINCKCCAKYLIS